MAALATTPAADLADALQRRGQDAGKTRRSAVAPDPDLLALALRRPDGQPTFAQSIPPAGPQSTASAAQPPPTPRPLQVTTGPGPSTPSPAAMGPQGASPFAVAPSFPSMAPPAADVPPAMAQGAPAGPPPGAPPPAAPGGAGGIRPRPAPIQPHQLERLQQLRGQAAQHPQVFGPVLMDYAAELKRQSLTPEQLVLSRPNAAGHAMITGKTSGRLYGLRTPDGAVIPTPPTMPPIPTPPRPPSP